MSGRRVSKGRWGEERRVWREGGTGQTAWDSLVDGSPTLEGKKVERFIICGGYKGLG